MIQTEIESSTPVLVESGRAKNFGWARRALFLYNPQALAVPSGYISESDTYIISSTTHLFVFEMVNEGWTRHILLTALSVREKRVFTKIISLPRALGAFMLPSGSEAGSVRISRGGAAVHFIIMEQGNRIIKIDVPNFGTENTLRGEVVLVCPPNAQSIVTNLPWKHEKGRFQYSRCSPWYGVEGVMQLENKDIVFSDGLAWGIFLWRRAVRPKSDTHFWAAGSGKCAEKHIAFSFGYGSVDTEYATENAFFINGKLYKLEYVTFKIAAASWTKPWVFTSSDGRVRIKFTPLVTEIQRYAGLFHAASLRRIYGVFSGHITPPDGESIEFQNITGLAERKKTRK
jgi:hypothetical protein